MRKITTFKINVKNGLYIGDLCYALDDRVYHKVWGKQNDYEDGAYVDPETGAEFAMVGTAYGDGYYKCEITDNEGYDLLDKYYVDAGIIGIADLSICTRKDEDGSDHFTGFGSVLPGFKGEVEITYDDGDIIVDSKEFSLVIYTTYDGFVYDEEDE